MRPLPIIAATLTALAACQTYEALAAESPHHVEYFVSPKGSDRNTGSSDSPWRTISRAVSDATPGATVHVAPGTYDETLDIRNSGTAQARIRVASDSKWSAKIWPATPVTRDLGVVNIAGSYVDFDGFDIGPASSSFVRVGIYTTGSYNKIARNKIHDINFTGSQVGSALAVSGIGSIIDSNYIYHTGNSQLDHGIYVWDGSSVLFNNVIGNISGYGISLWHTPQNVLIYNNTIFNGGTSRGYSSGGILIGAGEHPSSDARHCIVANNIVYGSKSAGIMEGGITHDNLFINNLTYNNARNWELANGTQSGSIIADPLFVDYKEDGTGDYSIRPISKAVDKGTPQYSSATDFDGNSRRNGPLPDVGAYEFQGEGLGQ